jgi:hypothetical protein
MDGVRFFGGLRFANPPYDEQGGIDIQKMARDFFRIP